MESINYNETILTNYQKKYPNLAEFIYDTKKEKSGFKIRRYFIKKYCL